MRPAMEMMLTGDAIDGREAERLGFANRALPIDRLEAHVLEMAGRIAKVDPALSQLNKRVVHRQMEVMGMRNGIRAGTDIHALGWHTQASADYMAVLRADLKGALNSRDGAFGDYRTKD
jgi:enoyl-CoA hydratase